MTVRRGSPSSFHMCIRLLCESGGLFPLPYELSAPYLLPDLLFSFLTVLNY